MKDFITEPLDGLNEPQKTAANAPGPVLVLAGAGTGKTTMTVGRIARLVAEGAEPSRILAVTFTNKAGNELRERVSQRLEARRDDGSKDPFAPKIEVTAGTFHSVSFRLLKERPGIAELEEGFAIADEAAAISIMRQVIDADPSLMKSKKNLPLADSKREVAKILYAAVQRLKERVLLPDTARAWAKEEDDIYLIAGARAYRPYQDLLRKEKLADFSDLLLWPVIGMQRDPALHRQWRGYWDHVVVDEYQDTNHLQHAWLKLFAGDGRNLCVVGDDDQAIYGFAGANVEFILEFERDYPGATVVRLEDNYRCSGRILAAANAVIAENEERRGKLLRAAAEDGEPVQIVTAATSWTEARWTARQARELANNDAANSMFVLYRANWQSRLIEEAMIDADIRYRIHGDVGFYGREEVRDCLALLRLMADGTDREAFARVVNKPARGVGAATLDAILQAVPEGRDVLAESASVDGVSAKAREGLKAFQEAIADARGRYLDETAAAVMFLSIETGYRRMWEDSLDANAESRLKNLDELCRAAEGREVSAFLERAELAKTMIDDRAPVTLMTLHASKGLEADWVILVGWEELIFPTKRAVEAEEEGDVRAIEDERRLAYVGITRSRARCAIVTHGDCRFTAVIPRTAADRSEVHIPRSPTPKQISFAEAIADALGLELPPDDRDNAEAVSVFIQTHKPQFDALRTAARH